MEIILTVHDALDVCGRDQTFNSKTDPVVCTEAGRLSCALRHYYLTDGYRRKAAMQQLKIAPILLNLYASSNKQG